MTTIAFPANSLPAIRERNRAGRIPAGVPLAMTASRLLLFAGFQALIALILWIAGRPAPWVASIAWAPAAVVLGSLVTLILLRVLARREGLRLVDLYNGQRGYFWKDLLVAVALLLIGGPISYFPNPLLATPLLGSPEAAMDMLLRPLPLWAAVIFGSLLPVVVALTELPLYFGYCMPRLTAQWGSRWAAWLVCSFFLAAQHIAFPLIFDLPYLAWRFLMFLPFALFVGLVLMWRPRLLPYMMVVHGLLDLSLTFFIIQQALPA